MTKQDVIPAGSQPLQVETTETKADNTTDNATKPEKLLGKFNSPEEMATSYKELEDTLGRQGSELGSLRKQMEAMNEDRAIVEAETGEQMPDFAEMKSVIETKVEEGEITVSEGMSQMAEITQQQTAAQMEEKFVAYDEKRSAEGQYEKFINENPEFLEMEESGALNDVMRQNPMHDKFSAFYAVKAKAESDAAYERGKEEALKIAKGADRTRSVLSKPGSNSRDITKPQKGMNDSEKVSGMMSALAAARG